MANTGALAWMNTGAFFKSALLKVQKLIPSLESDDIVPARAGVRAMALSKEEV